MVKTSVIWSGSDQLSIRYPRRVVGLNRYNYHTKELIEGS